MARINRNQSIVDQVYAQAYGSSDYPIIHNRTRTYIERAVYHRGWHVYRTDDREEAAHCQARIQVNQPLLTGIYRCRQLATETFASDSETIVLCCLLHHTHATQVDSWVKNDTRIQSVLSPIPRGSDSEDNDMESTDTTSSTDSGEEGEEGDSESNSASPR